MALTCPATRCRAENETQAERCARCGTPLQGYYRVSAHPAWLFNRGLAAARAGQLSEARDLFAAVVHWCPFDLEARNALAMACLTLGDKTEARRHWQEVLKRSPSDALAQRGLTALASDQPAQTATIQAGKDSAMRPETHV